MRRLALFLMFIFVLSGVSLWGQSDRATITGTVTDPTGAVIPGVDVVATNVDTGVQTAAVTNDSGLYSIRNLPIGKYSVTFEKQGFKKLGRQGITLSLIEVADLSVRLDLGTTGEVIVVVGNIPVLQTQTADVGTNLKGDVVMDLPITADGGRILEQFAFKTTPSVAGDFYQSVIAGGQTFSKEVLIDGTSATAQITGYSANSTPSMDAVEEFQVQTSGIRAETGRSGGGVFMFNMKSGTNKFHGSTFGFMGNELFDANSWMNNHEGFRKPRHRYFDYGVAAGGPIIRNKTFIFGAYERYWSKDLRLQTGGTVPTTAFLGGDFSSLLGAPLTDGEGNPYINPCTGGQVLSGQIFDPATTRTVGGQTCRDPFPGNIIPASRISSVAKGIVDIYKQHYAPVGGGFANNLIASGTPYQIKHQLSFKIDHNFSDKNRLSGSWIYFLNPRTLVDSGGIWQIGSEDGGPLARSRTQSNVSNEWRISDTQTFTPNVLSVFSVTYNEIKNYSETLANGGWPEKLGLGTGYAGNFPEINFGDSRGGWDITGIGNSFNSGFIGDNFILNESVSWVKGRHTMKFGGEWRAMQINSHQATGAMHFGFTPDQTGAPQTDYASSVGFGFASFLLGTVNDAKVDTPFDLYGRRKAMALYAQDDIRVSDRFTMNVDLRWEMTLPFHEKYGHWANFDVDKIDPTRGLPGTMIYLTKGSESFEKNLDWLEFSPHVGGAYRLSNKAVLRGSYGIFYSPLGIDQWTGVPYGFAPGYRGTNEVTPIGNGDPAFNWDSGYAGHLVEGTKDPSYVPYWPINIDPNSLKLGFVHEFSVGAQYELAKDLKLDVNYLGNRGRRLHGSTLRFNQANQAQYMALIKSGHGRDWVWDESSAAAAGVPYLFPGFSDFAVGALAPYPAVASWNALIFVGTPKGKSDYNAMQIELSQRPKKGLSFDFSYTLARARSNAMTNQTDSYWWGGAQEYTDTGLDQAAQLLNVWDQRHVFKGYFAYDLPFGKGKMLLGNSNGWLNAIVGGWTVSGLVRYNSGEPLSVYSSNWYPGWATVYPNVNWHGDFSNHFSGKNFDPNVPMMYFDGHSIFSNPADGELGTGVPRMNQLRGFGGKNEDAMIQKNVGIGPEGKYRLSMRFELYNLFNRHTFGNPDTNINSPTFGYVTSVGGTPRNGQFGARFTW